MNTRHPITPAKKNATRPLGRMASSRTCSGTRSGKRTGFGLRRASCAPRKSWAFAAVIKWSSHTTTNNNERNAHERNRPAPVLDSESGNCTSQNTPEPSRTQGRIQRNIGKRNCELHSGFQERRLARISASAPRWIRSDDSKRSTADSLTTAAKYGKKCRYLRRASRVRAIRPGFRAGLISRGLLQFRPYHLPVIWAQLSSRNKTASSQLNGITALGRDRASVRPPLTQQRGRHFKKVRQFLCGRSRTRNIFVKIHALIISVSLIPVNTVSRIYLISVLL